jgi:hypothetical protein
VIPFAQVSSKELEPTHIGDLVSPQQDPHDEFRLRDRLDICYQNPFQSDQGLRTGQVEGENNKFTQEISRS